MNTFRFPIRLILFFLLLSAPQFLSAQEGRDSTRVILDNTLIQPKGSFQFVPLELFPEKKTELPSYSSKLLEFPRNFTRKGEIRMPYQTNPAPLHRGDYRTGGVMKQFAHGAVFGSGGQTTLPGIGLFNNATIGYLHNFNDKWALELSANAMKINMTHITGQTFGTSGALLYRANERVSFKFFGTYDIGKSYGINTSSYGGTMSVDMSERFGMEMGAQRYYNSMRGHWETVPIVIPYFRVGNSKTKLGLDVGGIIYEILRETVFDKRGGGGGGGPTIAPPRLSLPIR